VAAWRALADARGHLQAVSVCDTNQGPIVLAATIRRRLADSDERIATVRCFLSPADRSYPGTLNRGPFTDRSATLMSAPYCVAIGLKYGTATVAGLREYDDPELLDDRADRDIADERLGALSSRLEILIAGAVLGSGTGDSAAFLRRPESS
jgi:hypothetical protein